MGIDYLGLRKKMIAEQLLGRGINDQKVLAAFEQVPRERFVSPGSVGLAYTDQPLPIGYGQTISQPYMVALMSQCLNLSKDETVLEIGTGSGFQTAILAELARQVYSVERLPSLAKNAQARLQELNYQNVRISISDGSCGWPEFAPYDKIIVTAAADKLPGALIEQLKTNGKLIIPLGAGFSQTLTKITKHRQELQTEQICGCVFVPLIGECTQK